jgi:hypothetical protein
MIIKTFLTFLTFFTSYSLLFVLNPKLGSSQHQWQDNIIKAQKFIYNDTSTIENVIIGSSLSTRLIMDSLPNFYNLSFSGQSLFDGLSILKNKNTFPKNVFIETNVIMRDESVDFTNPLFSTIPYYLNKNFIALRSDKQPIGIFISSFMALRSILKNKILGFKKSTINSSSNEKIAEHSLSNPKDELFEKMLDLQVTQHSTLPNISELKKKLELLSEYIKLLKDNNVNVYLFEMPINSNLVKLPKTEFIRNEINKFFKTGTVNYIQMDNDFYKTTDGVHLGNEEAIKYTKFFRTELNKYR